MENMGFMILNKRKHLTQLRAMQLTEGRRGNHASEQRCFPQ